MLVRFCAATSLLLLGWACTGVSGEATGADRNSGKLVITGSSTLAPLVGEIARRFESLVPRARVDVQSGGSSRGVLDVREQTADIAMVSRALYPEEADLTARTIARDGVAVVVHESNPLSAISRVQLARIYLDQVATWRGLSGAKIEVVVINKAAGRATLDVFARYLGLEPDALQGDVIIGENEQAIKIAEANPGSIAYVSIGTAARDIDLGAALRLVAVDGVEPTPEAIASGHYPIQRPLNLVTRGVRSPLAIRFIEYAASTAVDDLIRDFNLVSPSR